MNLNFKRIFQGRGKEELEKEVKELTEKLVVCKEKLGEKQEQINKTNAFWKKKLHDLTTKKKL